MNEPKNGRKNISQSINYFSISVKFWCTSDIYRWINSIVYICTFEVQNPNDFQNCQSKRKNRQFVPKSFWNELIDNIFNKCAFWEKYCYVNSCFYIIIINEKIVINSQKKNPVRINENSCPLTKWTKRMCHKIDQQKAKKIMDCDVYWLLWISWPLPTIQNCKRQKQQSLPQKPFKNANS